MIRSTGILLLASLLFLTGEPAWTQDEAGGPMYVKRLSMPVRGDVFEQPRAVVADLHADEIFVCDMFKNRIAIFDARGIFKYEIPGGAVFRTPIDLAADPDGYLLVLAMNTVTRGLVQLDFDGQPMGILEFTGLPEEAVPMSLQSFALSPGGDRIFAVDKENHRIWIVDRSGEIRGSVDLAEGLSEEERQDQILGRVDVYGDTVLMAVPSDGRVYRYDLDGNRTGAVGLKGAGSCQTAFPVAAAVDTDGQILVLDKQRAILTRWNPESNRCLGEYYGFGNAPGFFYQPGDLSFDRAGRIYVSQGFDGRVQVYESAWTAVAPAEQ